MTRFCSINWVALAACFIIVMGTPRLGAAALVPNGDFENIAVLTPWTLTGGVSNGIVAAPGTISGSAPSGNNYFQFGETGLPATLSQVVGGLIAGNNYSLSYYFAADPSTLASTPGTYSLQAQVGVGGVVFSNNVTALLTGSWQLFTSGSFLVSNSSETVSFLGRSDASFVGIDRVELNNLGPAVASVPEPTSMASMGLGLAIMAIRRHRRGRVQGAVESV